MEFNPASHRLLTATQFGSAGYCVANMEVRERPFVDILYNINTQCLRESRPSLLYIFTLIYRLLQL